jgi:hypothetical protein
MLLATNNTVIYGAGDRFSPNDSKTASEATGFGAVGRFGGVAEQLDAALQPGSRRLEMLAALWARQTGRAIVVAPGQRG